MPALFLYEPRMLLRTVVTHLVTEENATLQTFQSLPHLAEYVRSSTADNKTLLVGIGGAGDRFSDLLRFIREVKTMKVKTLVWIPAQYPWVRKLLNTLYVGKIIDETCLATALRPAVQELLAARAALNRQHATVLHPRRITLTELDILLQFASGLSSREMAETRQCSYKTIFSWKHNICEALNINTHAQWLEMLTEIVQVTSTYHPGKSYGPL
ncbi:helix-turn-helix transcriptional regulator [Pseudescherichia vulneris]